MTFWGNIQGTDGCFSEYKAGDWSLAPTGFGVRVMSQTLEKLYRPGAPAILARTMASQRKSIISLLILKENIRWGREYSNQEHGNGSTDGRL